MNAHIRSALLIFSLLALTAFILIIGNIVSLKDLNNKLTSTFYRIQSNISLNSPEILLQLDLNNRHCGQFGQKPTAEEAIEERHLLDSITWPGPPVQGLPVEFSSDPAKSYFLIRHQEKQHVGDQLVVNVYVQNVLGHAKDHGGDFIIARLHSPELGAGVAGKVTDHNDGNYTVLFPLLWPGVVRVKITMVHPSEAVAVLRRLQKEHPDRVIFQSLFRSGSHSEVTDCDLCLPLNQKPLCNYTDPKTGEPWYCYKPKQLGCDTRINHYKKDYKNKLINNYETQFFRSGVNIKAPIPAALTDQVTVLPAEHTVENRTYSAAGYYFNNTWRPVSGPAIRQFNDPSAVTHCLKGKLLYMLGDSTIRQWFEYLTNFVPNLKEFNLHSPKNVGPYMSVDSSNNIVLSFRCHGPPIRFNTVYATDLRYVANELDRIRGGANMVALVSVWSHFSTYPTEVYIRRLRHIRRAVVRLLNREPGTLVVIRTANLQKIDPSYSLYNSDWFSLQNDAVLRAMFKGLNVQLIDAWEMTLAHHLPHELHPSHEIIRNMMDIILSRICPVKGI